ncbi:MAG: nucleotidyltransferase family protein [Desulfococcaceae bacterium]
MNISIPKTDIQEFCRRNQIRRLSFFGSVLRDDFTAQSDVDVLVEFEPEARIGLITLSGMEIELTQILGRRVEIHTLKGLNPRFREEVLEAVEVTYEQA